jgi:hypothetical protein
MNIFLAVSFGYICKIIFAKFIGLEKTYIIIEKYFNL